MPRAVWAEPRALLPVTATHRSLLPPLLRPKGQTVVESVFDSSHLQVSCILRAGFPSPAPPWTWEASETTMA